MFWMPRARVLSTLLLQKLLGWHGPIMARIIRTQPSRTFSQSTCTILKKTRDAHYIYNQANVDLELIAQATRSALHDKDYYMDSDDESGGRSSEREEHTPGSSSNSPITSQSREDPTPSLSRLPQLQLLAHLGILPPLTHLGILPPLAHQGFPQPLDHQW